MIFLRVILKGLVILLTVPLCSEADTWVLTGRMVTDIAGHQETGIVFSDLGGGLLSVKLAAWRPTDCSCGPVSQKIDSISYRFFPPPDTVIESPPDLDGNVRVVAQWQSRTDRGYEMLTEQKYTISFDFHAKVDCRLDGFSDTTAYPIRRDNIPVDIRRYLSPGQKADSDSPGVVALASSLVRGCTHQQAAVSRILDWCVDSLSCSSLERRGRSSASRILELGERRVTEEDAVHVMIALLRAANIPARYVHGFSTSGEYNLRTPTMDFAVSRGPGRQQWAEVYYPDSGWIPYDPAGFYHFNDSHLIKCFAGEEYVTGRAEYASIPPLAELSWDSTCEMTILHEEMDLLLTDVLPTPTKTAFADRTEVKE